MRFGWDYVLAGVFCTAVVTALILMPRATPTPVPCYDFLDASKNVVVIFNKCTGRLEVRILQGGDSSEGAFTGPKESV